MKKLFGKYNAIIQGNIGINKYLAGLLLFVIPLYQKFPFVAIPGSQVFLRLEDVMIAVIFVVWLIIAGKDIKLFAKEKVTRAFFVFWLAGLLSLLSAIFLTKTVGFIGVLHFLRRIEYMIVFYIGISAVKQRSDLVFLIKCLMIVVAGIFIYGVGQKYLQWPVIMTQNSEYAKGIALRYVSGGHLISTFAGHYDLASTMIIVLPLLLALTFSSSKILSILKINLSLVWLRVTFGGLFVMGLWLLVNSASRISMASYFIVIFMIMIMIKRIKYIPLVFVFSLVLMSTSSNLMDRYTRLIKATTMRVLGITTEEKSSFVGLFEVYAAEEEVEIVTQQPIYEDRSSSIRFNVEWPRAIRALMKNPILGTGYSSLTLATDNDYLRILGETGVLGFLSFMLVVASVIWELVKNFSFKLQSIESIFLASVIAGIPGVAINMVFIDILEASKFAIIFWLFLGMAVAASRMKKTND